MANVPNREMVISLDSATTGGPCLFKKSLNEEGLKASFVRGIAQLSGSPEIKPRCKRGLFLKGNKPFSPLFRSRGEKSVSV